MINIDLLSKVCKIPGAPGYEQRIREFVIKTVEPYVDEVSTDAMGNVIAVKKGSSDKKVMVAALSDVAIPVKDGSVESMQAIVVSAGHVTDTLTIFRAVPLEYHIVPPSG